jgi:hypothetical protein
MFRSKVIREREKLALLRGGINKQNHILIFLFGIIDSHRTNTWKVSLPAIVNEGLELR